MIWRWLESLLQPPWLLVSFLSRCWSLNTFSTWQIKAASDAVSMAQNVRRQEIMTWFKFWHETWPMWQALRCFPFNAGILTETHILSSYLFQVWLSSIPDIWHLSFRFPAKKSHFFISLSLGKNEVDQIDTVSCMFCPESSGASVTTKQVRYGWWANIQRNSWDALILINPLYLSSHGWLAGFCSTKRWVHFYCIQDLSYFAWPGPWGFQQTLGFGQKIQAMIL